MGSDGTITGSAGDPDAVSGLRFDVVTVEEVGDIAGPGAWRIASVGHRTLFASIVGGTEQDIGAALRHQEIDSLQERGLAAVVLADEEVHAAEPVDFVVFETAIAVQSERCQHGSGQRVVQSAELRVFGGRKAV